MANDLKVVAPAVPQTEAEYNAWFRKQVEEGLREADDPGAVWVSNEEVFRNIDQRLKQRDEHTSHKKAS